ncbi:MAG: SIS domain-containing protein [Lachnospiraceae bacterium]|nr:SIS domain-containing protein [Lachnospiraceae bacterium]
MGEQIKERVSVILKEHEALLACLNEEALESLAEKIANARAVFFTAQGRSGNMARALAIRFLHMGIAVHVAGEPSTPAIGAGDLLIAISSSAKTKITLNHLETAKKERAATALLTAAEDPGVSDMYVRIPAKTGIPSVQHAGSLFEQAILLVGDALAWYVQGRLGASEESMNQRHSNLQ